ncbi:MAG: toll/interleukin-1 receptor domain-containing protein [Chloroflexi bacterium]|nr:toll/interleukin-1 receptor domain-containing protein [Chloroflexota bacterium]
MFRSHILAYGMPTPALPDDFLPRTTQLLLPRLSTPDEREAWLAQAFFLNDPRLYHDLRQMTGMPIVYVTRCITALLTAKCIPGRDIHSLALLLNAVRIGSAPSEQREIDTLVTLLDPMCGPDSAPDPVEPNVVESPAQPVVKPTNPLQTIDTPEDQRTPTVFISYAHIDDEFAVRLIADLQNAGHAIWIDTVSIKGGDAWVRSIADGIRNSYAFLTIVSPDANSSRWVLREYLLAENLQKPIYPVLARQADIPFQMIDRQVVMMHQDYADGLRELLETLPAPKIPVPRMEDILKVATGEMRIVPPPAAAPPAPQPRPVRPPAPITPAQRETEQPDWQNIPPAQTSSSSRGGGLGLPDIGGALGDFFGGLRDMIGGRQRDKEASEPDAKSEEGLASEAEKRQEGPAPTVPEPPRRSQAPGASLPEEAAPDVLAEVFGGVSLDDDEAAPVHQPNRRALELQYVQRQWAEAFSHQQDAPETADDMIVRWMKLSSDADLDADSSGAESGHVDNVGAGLMSMRRAVVMGDSPRETAEAVWSALGVLMKDALSDPTKPLPIIINLAKWTDAAQPLEGFVQEQLGELGGYWQGLLDQKRAALLFTGFEDLPEALRDARKDAIEALLRQHPELPVLVVMQG